MKACTMHDCVLANFHHLGLSVESSKSQGRTAVPFLREDGKGTLREVVVQAGAGWVIGSMSSSDLDNIGGVCGRDLMVGGGGEFYWAKQEEDA